MNLQTANASAAPFMPSVLLMNVNSAVCVSFIKRAIIITITDAARVAAADLFFISRMSKITDSITRTATVIMCGVTLPILSVDGASS